jgi:flagellar hook-associated protein 1 FlgK
VAITTPGQLAVSGVEGAADGSNAQKVADLAVNSTARATIGSAGPSELWQNLTYGTGSAVKALNTAITSQTAMVAAAKSAVSSESGVNLDEELAEMLQYQRSYQAASKVITIIDDMLSTLIGMVR